MNPDQKHAVQIDYTNHRGERGIRTIIPDKVEFGSSPYHPMEQYLLRAFDHDRQDWRQFAMNDIHSWRPADERDMATSAKPKES